MRPEAVAAMVDVLESAPGNPSGQHRWARQARRLLDDARDRIAEVIGADPGDIVFTSGGTEADNLAVTGTIRARGGRALCLTTDHHAVIDPVLAAGGSTFGARGRVSVRAGDVALATVSTDERPVSLVSFALVNNEVGVVQPAVELVESIRRLAPGALIHIDAVAAAAWLDLAPAVAVADLISLSGHKVGGPKGIGVLAVRGGAKLSPILLGGSQERERRGGTPNVAGAVAFAVALERSSSERAQTVGRVAAMRDRLMAGVLGALGSDAAETVAVVDDGDALVANIAHLSCWGVHREALLFRLDQDGVAASAGSSCASGAMERSHVIDALELPVGLTEGALRLSLGWNTTDAEVDHALSVVPAAVRDLRGTAVEGSAA